ncbi:hypothetical protein [Pseudomonas aeruginosa]|uniref:hypothetical protein n=1 Tax=Pseudomonas aeruginosa TaxID=287 RepID=UPI0008FADFA6|nr:hypothetical protein [Pseudomonas aeruginosa]
MRRQCIQAVQQAIGRPLNQPEIKDIEARISRNMRELARIDPNWQTLTRNDRITAAGQRAANELTAEAAKARQRTALTILAHDRVQNFLEGYDGNRLEALDRILAFSSDYPGIQSIESASRAIRDEAMGRLLDVIDQTRGRFLGLIANREGTTALVRELHGEDSGVPAAREAARQYHEVAESLRQRFNRAGGDIGRLDDWALPRGHSQYRIARDLAGWVDQHMGWVDRSRYLNEDGTRMTDDQLRDFLTHAGTTLATGGVNKVEPGRVGGSGMRANRGSESRQIHYRDADAYMAAQEAYGDKNIMDLMFGHIDQISRDIALVETLGPNPNHAFKYFSESAFQHEAVSSPRDISRRLNKQRKRLDYLYTEVAGTREPPVSARIANWFDTYRGINVASRLGSAVITGFSDQGTIALTAKMNGMPVMRVFSNEAKMLNPLNDQHRRIASRAGLGIDQLMGSMARWGADGLGHDAEVAGRASGYSQTAATTLLRASGMNAIDAANRRAFGATMMDAVGYLTRNHESMSSLEAGDRARLRNMGVTDTDFSVWRLAETEDWRGIGDTILTAGSIYRITDEALSDISARTRTSPQRLRDQAATKLLGSVLDETNMAIPAPGARERAFMHGGKARGEWGGELARSFWQFKSYSVSMVMKHWKRAFAQQTGWGKAGYMAAIFASTTVLGAISLQLNEILLGRDPKNMLDADDTTGVPGLRFALAAMLKGGALSIYGDFLFSDTTSYGTSPLAAIGGPVAGDIEALFKIRGTAQDLKGDQLGGNLVKFAKSHIPGANLWYTKAATDHMIFHQLQEYFSPGYLRRMEQRARKEFGQSYWWEPGDYTPRRAPALESAFGP